MKPTHITLFMCLYCLSSIASANPAWQTIHEVNNLTGQRSCVLHSTSNTLFDGYSQTKITLRITNGQLMVVTDSNIDPKPVPTLVLDAKHTFVMDSIEEKTNLLFKTRFDDIIQSFIKGSESVLSVRFWPTWPITHTYQSRFSLKGFSKAFKNFQTCIQLNG